MSRNNGRVSERERERERERRSDLRTRNTWKAIKQN